MISFVESLSANIYGRGSDGHSRAFWVGAFRQISIRIAMGCLFVYSVLMRFTGPWLKASMALLICCFLVSQGDAAKVLKLSGKPVNQLRLFDIVLADESGDWEYFPPVVGNDAIPYASGDGYYLGHFAGLVIDRVKEEFASRGYQVIESASPAIRYDSNRSGDLIWHFLDNIAQRPASTSDLNDPVVTIFVGPVGTVSSSWTLYVSVDAYTAAGKSKQLWSARSSDFWTGSTDTTTMENGLRACLTRCQALRFEMLKRQIDQAAKDTFRNLAPNK